MTEPQTTEPQSSDLDMMVMNVLRAFQSDVRLTLAAKLDPKTKKVMIELVAVEAI